MRRRDKTLIGPMRAKKDSAAAKKIASPPCSINHPTRHDHSASIRNNMASVYKSISKANGEKSDGQNGVRKNKQRVLILSSRGVTYR